jgi:hypothetical protein
VCLKNESRTDSRVQNINSDTRRHEIPFVNRASYGRMDFQEGHHPQIPQHKIAELFRCRNWQFTTGCQVAHDTADIVPLPRSPERNERKRRLRVRGAVV